MFISKRLNKLVDLIEYSTLGDIACDHGFISILACANKNITKSIACDLNKDPLSKCEQNAKQYGYSDIISTRLFDGLKGLESSEVETIIIAGIGGNLMHKILTEREEVVKSSKQLILQPQSDVELVRKYISQFNFNIRESFLEDNGKYYIILNCIASDTHEVYEERDFIIGKNPIVDDEYYKYIKHRISTNNNILDKISKDNEKYQNIEKANKILKGVLENES